jgi:hypothetical protein
MQNTTLPSWIDQPAIYQIIIKGRLDANWTEWFDNLTISVAKDKSETVFTTLTGPIMDQGVLHGLLGRIRDLGLTLLEVRRLGAGDSCTPAAREN